jgi:hypothetical protein
MVIMAILFYVLLCYVFNTYNYFEETLVNITGCCSVLEVSSSNVCSKHKIFELYGVC